MYEDVEGVKGLGGRAVITLNNDRLTPAISTGTLPLEA